MTSKNNLHQLPSPCPHLTDFRSRHGSKPFRLLQKCLRVKPLGRAEIRRDSLEIPHCSTCSTTSPPRLYACVTCATVSCHSPPDSSHAALHSESSPGHDIAVDIDRAELFCCACRDQVYDRDFDASVVIAQTSAATMGDSGGPTAGSTVCVIPRPKRRRVNYRPWTEDPGEELLNEDGDGNGRSTLPWGLRGLNNLGNTCFMNSVLQALLHTPPLRNYFLSDRHNRYVCQQKNSIANVSNDSSSRIRRLCLACDTDAMFSALFSGDRTPYSPARFLYSWWQHAANLASYEQQDAHEFFISMLDGIHEKVDKERGKTQNQGDGDCCIAHRVFSGILRSDVTCTVCGFTSTTYDPCVDISLDLEPNHGASLKMGSTKTNHACNGDADSTISGQHSGISTLVGCFDRFTRPERLGSDQKFFCQQCKVRQESLKQMSIRKLPLVSCFHIKRFEHSSLRNMSRKVDRYLQFPFSLDMSPYLSSSILRSRYGNRIFTSDGDETDASNDLSSEFELFAVVTHTGKLDAGHYVTYLRLNNQWYKCDDAWISQVSEHVVRATQAYMMFYVQKTFHYRACEKLVTS